MSEGLPTAEAIGAALDEALRRSESEQAAAWPALLAAAPEAVAGCLERFPPAEGLVAAVGVGLLRPEVAAVAARAHLARPGAAALEVERFLDRTVVERWLDAVGLELTAAELVAWFPKRATYHLAAVVRRRHLVPPFAERRAEAERMREAVSLWDRSACGVIGACIARAVLADGGDPTAAALRANADASDPPFVAEPGGGEEARALAEVLEIFASFLPADHPAVLDAVERLARFGKTWVKGMDYELSRAAEVCARAADRDSAWLSHAERVTGYVGRDAAAQAAVRAAEIRLGRRDPSEAIEAPAPRPYVPPSLGEVAQRELLWYRASGGLAHAVRALESGDRALAEAAIRVAFSPPAEPLSDRALAWWLAADLSVRGEPGLLLDALVTGREPVPEALVELLSGLDDAFVPAAFERLAGSSGRGLWSSCGGSHSRVLDFLLPALRRADGALRARAIEVLRGIRHEGTTFAVAEREQSRLRALAALDPEGPEVDPRERVARAVARGAWREAEQLASEAERAWIREVRTSAPGAAAPQVDFAARTVGGEDAEVLRHRVARIHLAEGRIDEAVALCRAMGATAVSGMGPAALAVEIAAVAGPERAAELLGILAGPAVHPQDIPAALLAIAASAPSGLLVEGEPRLAALGARLRPGDRSVVDVAIARARLGEGRIEEGLAALERALDAGDAGYVHAGPGAVLGSLRTCADRISPEAFARLWRRAIAQYRAFRAGDAASSLRWWGRGALPSEVGLWMAEIADPAWPDEVRLAMFEVVCEIVARGPGSEVLPELIAQASTLGRVRRVTVAAACLLARRGDRGAAMLAARAGLPNADAVGGGGAT